MKTLILTALAIALAAMPAFNAAAAAPKYKVGVSIYVGWMPWYYAGSEKIVNKIAEKHGIEIQIVPMDYIPSIEAYVAGQVDACVMTNMEALDMPAAAGIDSTAVILGDYSNGNDALLVRNKLDWAGLKGKKVLLAELSVSHYLLVRGLEANGLKESDVNIVNTSDADIGPVFIANKNEEAVVTWNPMVMQIEATPGVTKLYDSSKVPGEILDLMVVNTKKLTADPKLGAALVEIWYEVIGKMSQRGPAGDAVMAPMAERSGATLEEFKGQLKTTAMFSKPSDAVAYTSGAEIKAGMETVRQFCFAHGLLGEGAKSVDFVGISFPDGTIQGDPKNVKLRFDATYMKAAVK